MIAQDRLADERAFHDRQARDRAACPHPGGLLFRDDDFLDHESWIRPAFAKLGDLRGRDALDYGCGHGMAAVVMARQGPRVPAFDVSAGYVAEARARADANGAPVHFLQADAERLPFAGESFDRVWGNAVLHHLDLAVAARELCRVLRPGGVAVFCEPWGENPVLNWARRRLSYPAKGRTPDEEPLHLSQLRMLWEVFEHIEIQG